MRHHRPRLSPAPHRRVTVAVLGATLGLALIAGCGASQSGSGAAGSVGSSASRELAGPAAGSAAGSAPSAVTDSGAKMAADAGTTGVAAQAQAQRKLTRQADLSLTVRSVDRAAAEIRSITAAAKGVIMSEQISADPQPVDGAGPATASTGTLTISVPAETLDATLDQLGRLGTVVSLSTNTADVTASYVDTQSRLATMRASIDRVRALMSRATRIGDIVALESELSSREADLESLQAQLNALDSAVAMSPVSIRLSTTPPKAVAASSGFVDGLKAGWDAFVSTGTVLLTALGAALPFLLVVALLGWPVVLWLRRRRASRLAAPGATAAPSA